MPIGFRDRRTEGNKQRFKQTGKGMCHQSGVREMTFWQMRDGKLYYAAASIPVCGYAA